MTTRRPLIVLIAVVVSMLALTPLCSAALADNGEADPLPVQGSVVPTGDFVGTLRIVACTLDASGHLQVTGLLSGTATYRTGARLPVSQQPFTTSATLHDPGRTTDVVLLALAPITLDPLEARIRLAPIFVDIEALPDVSDQLATLLSPP